jgi:uncharacterized protein (TIGR03067 family)
MRAPQTSVIALAFFGGVAGWGQEQPRDDNQAIQGSWRVVDQQPEAKPDVRYESIDFVGDKLVWHSRLDNQRGVTETTFKLDPAANPKALDFTNKHGQYVGIYELKDGKLKICYRGPGKKRPAVFKAGDEALLITLVPQSISGN